MISEIFDTFLKFENNKENYLIDFFADWCIPCKKQILVLNELDKRLNYKLLIFKCNVEKNIKIINKFNILSIPTIIFFKKKNEINFRINGFKTCDFLEKEIKKYIKF